MKPSKIIILMLMSGMTAMNAMSQQSTNDFYDDAVTNPLKGKTNIEIAGEIGNPGIIDITTLPERSLIIKEAISKDDSNRFIGAYRYDGYSLYDILNHTILKKKNETEFPPIIDMYVKVENDNGESVIISWGEIYYPVHRHEIIIATKVARIVPSKTKDLWPLPEDIKLIVGTDLVTDRNISNPTRITVYSLTADYKITKGMSPLFQKELKVYDGGKLIGDLISKEEITNKPLTEYNTIFYGRGRGIHSTTPFRGYLLKECLAKNFKMSPELLKSGYFVVASIDGYRCIYTYSEIMNRNDQAEVLLIYDPENQDGGAFRLFPAGDFFSDRAVKAVSEIKLFRD